LDWSRFNLHGDAPERAFEALTGILFERWCHREYAAEVTRIVFVNGAGGDGGVEAYAQLKNGQFVGLQAKWFREPLQSSQIGQIEKSLKTAATVRKKLLRYVVAVPRDLSDPKRDISKATKRKTQSETERDRWDEFVEQLNQEYPNVTIELWGETQIAELLAELGSEGLRRYWFEGSVVDVDYLRLKFEQARSGWLKTRYSPDLHQSGQVESDLQLRLDGPASRPKWLKEASQLRILLEDAHVAILRLRRYPQFMQRDDAEALIKATEEWIISAIAEQQELERRVAPGNSFPLPNFDGEVPDDAAPWQLIDVLMPEKKETSESITSDIGKQLEDALNRWHRREVTPKRLRVLGQPAAYVGEPGVGKTDALANSVHQRIEEGKPAILIRAKDIDLTRSWDSVLAEAVGEAGWNVRQILDALEAAATQAEVRAVEKTTDNSECQPVRVLVAIDGLDETSRAERWAEKLGELLPLAKQYPRVLFVGSLRTSLYQRISIPNKITLVRLRGSDAPLGEVFESYCNINRIECPPVVRWALRTPLAIRLFADLYQEKRIDTVTLQKFTLVSLIGQKINHAESAIRESDSESWTETITPVRDTLCAIVKACFSKGKPLSQAEALQIAEEGQTTPGILSRRQLLCILDKCLEHGLLLLRRQPSDDPLEAYILFWEPAYQALTDFLLAREACNSAKADPANPNMPKYLRYRGEDALVLAAYLLGMDGYDFFATGLWANDLSDQRREDLRLTTILMMPPERGLEYRDWVAEIFKRDMASCRQVLDRLVIPGLRIPGYYYGAKFIHDTLLPMKVAERDLFWSGPNYLPHNHGAPWEGYGEPVLDKLEIADDDSWEAAPLLLAWATTTVKNNTRRRIRAALAVWGSQKPNELLSLLKEACQTNDPQMKEDVLSAAYGASCLIRPDETWLPLCNWIIDSFFLPNAPLYTHDVIVRHCTRSLIERCIACKVPVDEERLVNVRVPYVNSEQLLCIDRQAAINTNEYWKDGLLTYDLARYVVPRAINPFFKESSLAGMHQANSQVEEDDDELEGIDEIILSKFVEGSLRNLADIKARQHVEEVLRQRAEKQAMMEAFHAPTDEEHRKLLEQWGIQIEEEGEEEETSETQDEAQFQPGYSPSAQAFLSQYAANYALQELTPMQLAFGFVSAYAAKLGWSREVFIKEPNGGEPGEVIGADIAILREYRRATHGSRSSTATFAEKYVWAARNELFGFLADRVAAHVWNRCVEPPVELNLLAEVTNPASDVGFSQLQLNQVLEFSELVPDADLSETVQVDRANEWVQKAPLPDIKPLLFLSTEKFPEWAKNHEWIVLREFVIRRHADSQAESVLRTSSFLFPSNALSLLEEDVQLGILPELYEFSSRIVSDATYCDPCEAIWASWIQEEEGLIRYSTLDTSGNPTKFNLQAGTCQFQWNSPDGENEEWIPTKMLQKVLGIVDFHAGQFFTDNGQVQAFTFDSSGEHWRIPSCQVLLARRDAVLEVLKRNNLSMGWGVWLNRDPVYPLNVSSRKRMLRDWHATVFWAGDELKTVTYKDLTEPWYKDEL
jgi:hypothetical protein